MKSPNRGSGGGGRSSLGTLLIGCAATLFIASRLWFGSREVVHLRAELAALQASAGSATQQAAAQQTAAQSSPSSAEPGGGGSGGADGLAAAQPLLYFSVRARDPLAAEPPPLQGPLLEEDPLPVSSDPEQRLLGQVNMVEAGRVHGWACVKGAASTRLAVTLYVDGVRAGSAPAALPTHSQHVRTLCALDELEEGAGGAEAAGLGFTVPLPPLAQGLHVLRAFVSSPDGTFRQELNQSPLLFRESAVSPDQEERIRRKDAIIQTRNAQVAALWDELHTRLPWRNAVDGDKPIQPFPAAAEEEERRRRRAANETDLVLFIGVNTGLGSRRRRDILRRTWVPNGGLDQLERRLGVRIRFFVGRSQQRGDDIEKQLQAEMKEFGDMERLDVVDEYGELSRKTARLFAQMSTAVRADFYFKIDDDVAVNVEALADYLRERRQQGNLYLGCMKSGEVLTDKRWKWYEPEHWRFGDPAGGDSKVNYMRHASGQIYGMSRPVARFLAQNEAILHRYANEDVSVGAWLVGLDVVYDNQRRLCCDTEWKCTGQTGRDNVCLAFSENQCAGLCRSEERLEGIYRDCVLDAYNAGKKGKLPWWGQSGWSSASHVSAAHADSKDKAGDKEADGKEAEQKKEGEAGDKVAKGEEQKGEGGGGSAAGGTQGGTADGTAGAAGATTAGGDVAAGRAAGAVGSGGHESVAASTGGGGGSQVGQAAAGAAGSATTAANGGGGTASNSGGR